MVKLKCGRKILKTTLCLYLCFSFSGDAFSQENKVLKTVNDLIKIGEGASQLSQSMKRFMGNIKMTTREFNETVTVVKGDKVDKSQYSSGKANYIKIKKGEAKNLSWGVQVGFEGDLFPSAIIGLANYKGALNPSIETVLRPIGIRLGAESSNLQVKWEVECTDKRFFDKISGYQLCEQKNQAYSLNPEIPWNFSELAKNENSISISLIIRLFDEEGNKVEKTVTGNLRSISDCLKLTFEDSKIKDNVLNLYTAYIQEEHPEIKKILKEATDTKMVDYISGDVDSLKLHKTVAAIWRVLHDRGINYANITTTAVSNNAVATQAVRSFGNSINDKQANCVDGTIVFASILRKIGIHSALVLVKGHCFLAYYPIADKNGVRNFNNIVFLETTVLDNAAYIDVAMQKANKITDKSKIPKIINDGYWQQFMYARSAGQAAYDEAKEGIKSNNNFIFIIDVDEERKKGIQPIPFQ